MRPSIEKLLARLTDLEAAVKQTKADVAASDERAARAEDRAARAEARAVRLEQATGNLAAAVVDPKPISRRNLLMKAAGVGAAGVAGSLLLNRKEASAAFTWTGGTLNAADAETIVLSNAGFGAGAVLRLDPNQGSNGSTPIDGLQTFGSSNFSGVAAFGGNNAGLGYYGVGGPATGSGSSGGGMLVYSGTTAATQYNGQAIQAYQNPNQPGRYTWTAIVGANGAADHSSTSNGLYAYAADHGWGLWGDGGPGNGATPPTGGGVGTYGNSGPGNVGVVGYGDSYSYNPAVGSHGTAGFGNALGVGGWFTGGRAALALGSAGTAGPPATLLHSRGDVYLDVNEVLWICITSGTPGVFEPLQPGGMNNALYTAVSTSQYTLSNSDGLTWTAIDVSNLKLTITPTFNCQAQLTGTADLWTANAGFNQDIGIMVSGGAFPTSVGQPEGWKESGGFAGTFSPNAAFVETIVPLAAGTTYTVTLVWKTNHSGTSTIAAGAGPIAAKFSPTRLSARLIATKPGGLPLPITTPVPYEIPAEARPPVQQRPGTVPPMRKL
jgi:hypothetical protein